MSEENRNHQNVPSAQRLQERFEFYVIGLTFAILGLSIQTAKFTCPLPSDALELMGWISPLVSGLAGLSRGEAKPHIYAVHDMKSDYEDRATTLKRAFHGGQIEITNMAENRIRPIDEVLAETEGIVEKVKRDAARLEQKAKGAYRVQRCFFVLGITELLCY